MQEKSESDALHSLIHQMGKGELRYFRLFARQNVKQGNSIHLQLFDLLLGMEDYGEIDFRKQANLLKLPVHLSAAKYQLRKLIFKSLRAFHQSNSSFLQLHGGLFDVALLHEKGLLKQASKELRNIQRKAAPMEEHHVLLQVLDWELRLFRAQQPTDLLERIAQNKERRKELQEELEQESILHALYTQALVLSRVHRGNQQQFIKEMEPLLAAPANKKPGKSFVSQIYQCQIQGLYHLLSGAYEKASDTYLEHALDWEKRPEMISGNSELYMLFQLNFLNSCFFANRPQLLTEFLPKLHAVLPRLKGNVLSEIRRVYQLELMFRMNFGHLDKARELVPEIKEWLRKNQRQLAEEEVYSLSYNCAVFLFVSGDFKAAQLQIKLLLDMGKPGLRPDIYDFALLFQLVIYLQRRELDLLAYRLRSSVRALKKQGSPGKYFAHLLTFFKTALTTPENEWVGLATVLEEQLDSCAIELKGNLPLGYYEMRFWLKSLTDRIPISDVYQDALLKRQVGGTK